MGYTPHVLVVGGGVTGTAIARDLSIRGLDVTVIERDTLASGATGLIGSLLRSGAGYAETDPTLARRCRRESQILRSIAGHCIDDTGGLLVGRDPDEAFEALLAACRECEIPVEEIPAETIRATEPSLSSEIDRAARVPDAAVDPYRLTLDTARSAQEHGATIYTHTEVTDLLVEDGSVVGVSVSGDPEAVTDGGTVVHRASPGRDIAGSSGSDKVKPGETSSGGKSGSSTSSKRSGTETKGEKSGANRKRESGEIRADYVVNAAGAHAGEIASMADIDLPLTFDRETVVLSTAEPTESVLRRRGTSPEGTVVPAGSKTVLGTAVDSVDGPGDETGIADAVDDLLETLPETLPGIENTRLPRAEWGVRTDLATTETSRGVSIDHLKYHDIWGLMTVVGSQVTTHRHLAERVVDHVCSEFGIDRECRTDELPLVSQRSPQAAFGVKASAEESTPSAQETIVCPCVGVSRTEIHEAIDDAGTPTDLNDVRIRTWAATGECQGGRCAHRMATQLYPGEKRYAVESAVDGLLAERWSGQRHTLWGEQLSQAMETYLLHSVTMDRTAQDASQFVPNRFDDGRTDSPDRPTHCPRGPP